MIAVEMLAALNDVEFMLNFTFNGLSMAILSCRVDLKNITSRRRPIPL